MADPDELSKVLRELEKRLVDDGKLIEAGWISLRAVAINPEAGKAQLDAMREAFFAGAQHLFGSIMGVLEDGDDATEADMRRLDNINAELKGFIREFEKKHGIRGRH